MPTAVLNCVIQLHSYIHPINVITVASCVLAQFNFPCIFSSYVQNTDLSFGATVRTQG